MKQDNDDKVVDKEETGNKGSAQELSDDASVFVGWIEGLPAIVKLVLCIPVVDAVWSVWRLMKAIAVNDGARIVLALLLLVLGIPFIWVLDLVFVLLTGNGFWF